MTLILLYIGDDKPEVGCHQPLGRQLVPLLGQTSQAPLFHHVGDERELLNVVQVLVESG